MTPARPSRLFGEMATFRNGVNFSAASRNVGDLAVIGVGDFKANDRLMKFDDLERIARPAGLDDEALLRDGDLVFVRSNGNRALIGRCMILSGVVGPVTHSGFTIRARLTSDDVSPEWIALYFATGLATREMMRRGGGTNISNLSQRILQDLPIPIAEPHYQQRVLRVADEYSRTLQLLDADLHVKRRFKRGLMQQLLSGLRRFAGCQGGKWKALALGELVRHVPRKVPKPTEAFLSAGVRSHGKGVFLKKEFQSNDIALEELFELKHRDLIVNITFGWEGAVAIVPQEADGALVSHRFPTYEVDESKILVEYLRHAIQSKRFISEVGKASPGGAGRNRVLSRRGFLGIPLRIPCIDEQRRISEVLNACDREIDLLRAQRQLVDVCRRTQLARAIAGDLVIPS